MKITVAGSLADALQIFEKNWKDNPVVVYYNKDRLNCTVLLCALDKVGPVYELLASHGFTVFALIPDDEYKFQELWVYVPLNEVVSIFTIE